MRRKTGPARYFIFVYNNRNNSDVYTKIIFTSAFHATVNNFRVLLLLKCQQLETQFY